MAQNNQTDGLNDPKSFAERIGFEPVVIKHPSLRGWDFAGVFNEIARRFAEEAMPEWVRRAMQITTPGEAHDKNSLIQTHAKAVAASLVKIISSEKLTEILSTDDQSARKRMVDGLIKEIRDQLSRTAVFIEFPPRVGRKRSEEKEKRDLKILQLHEQDGLSFGQIAARLKLGPQGRYTASSACQRAVRL